MGDREIRLGPVLNGKRETDQQNEREQRTDIHKVERESIRKAGSDQLCPYNLCFVCNRPSNRRSRGWRAVLAVRRLDLRAHFLEGLAIVDHFHHVTRDAYARCLRRGSCDRRPDLRGLKYL